MSSKKFKGIYVKKRGDNGDIVQQHHYQQSEGNLKEKEEGK